ncbi:MAG: endolytic transglycosylase MltG [Micavibrio sp.]|nr:endolytic transglycosylase MltG [Micavibrio sp.]
MANIFKSVIALLFFTGAVAGLCVWLYVQAVLPKAGPMAQDTLFYIPPSSSVQKIAEQLQAGGAINEEWVFRYGAWAARTAGALKAGEYQVKAHASPASIIALLQSGKVYQHQLTIPEGLTSFEIIGLVNNAPAMNGGIETIPAEGTLLPETYNYTYGESRTKLVDRMARNMQTVLAQLWKTHADGILLKTPQEAVTLASIVEKETGLAAERPRIAGVFMNRLHTGMPLQSDPTVIYAVTMGKMKMDRSLTRADLELSSPYNTYQVNTLPPGPIANPGKASLEAVMHPEANGFFFFVADGSGGHAFARTNDEHVANVAKWRQLQHKAQSSGH